MNNTPLTLILILLTLGLSQSIISQNDSLKTAFRKGRWLTGLSGNISSTTTQVDNSNFKTTANNYGINIESGKFLKNRWLVGGLFQANKASTSGNIEKTTETFYIGPFSNYYFMDGNTGSLFTRLSLGYIRYRDETKLMTQNLLIEEFSEGGGLGSIVGLGYSYTMNDFIAFDLGINVNLFWVSIEQESLPIQTITNTNISSNDISFSFGFNIILDDFFF